jgi:DNA repair photolyase
MLLIGSEIMSDTSKRAPYQVSTVIEQPIPHIRVKTKKRVVHGWHFPFSSGRRECSSERILINPYNGCSVNCPECYARAYGGYFERWDRSGVITVFEDINLKLSDELSRLYYTSCGYFSPITDPFQHPLEETYHLSERCMDAFLDLDLPVEFVTKIGSNIPERLLNRMSEHPFHDCFCQYTILSLDDAVRRHFSPGGSTPEEQLSAVRRSKDHDLYTVVRIDPVLPGINDSESDLLSLVEAVKLNGGDHIIASVCDVNVASIEKILATVRSFSMDAFMLWRRLYKERMGSSYQASIGYRRSIFGKLKEICKKQGLTFALCMEFSRTEGVYQGMNREYMTSKVCEGKAVPVYRRENLTERFSPIKGCDGDCLSCAQHIQAPSCGKSALAEARALKFSDYFHLKPNRDLFDLAATTKK